MTFIRYEYRIIHFHIPSWYYPHNAKWTPGFMSITPHVEFRFQRNGYDNGN